MGNYNFKAKYPPQPGQVCTIVDNSFSQDQKYPRSIYYQGQRVRVLGTKDLLCSRQNFQPVSVSLVEFEDGRRDVYLTTNLQ